MNDALHSKNNFAQIANNINTSSTGPDFGLISSTIFALSGVLLLSILVFLWKNKTEFQGPDLKTISIKCFARAAYIPLGFIVVYTISSELLGWSSAYQFSDHPFVNLHGFCFITLLSGLFLGLFSYNLIQKKSILRSLFLATINAFIIEPVLMIVTLFAGAVVFMLPLMILIPFNISPNLGNGVFWLMPAVVTLIISYIALRKYDSNIKKSAFKQIIITLLFSLILIGIPIILEVIFG